MTDDGDTVINMAPASEHILDWSYHPGRGDSPLKPGLPTPDVTAPDSINAHLVSAAFGILEGS